MKYRIKEYEEKDRYDVWKKQFIVQSKSFFIWKNRYTYSTMEHAIWGVDYIKQKDLEEMKDRPVIYHYNF